MINYDPLLLDELTEDEFWLLQQVVRHLNTTTGEAYPGTKKLQQLTKWSDIKKVRRVRQSLSDKGFFRVSPRYLPDGRQTSNNFSIITRRVQLFLGADQVQEMRGKIEDLEAKLATLLTGSATDPHQVPAPAMGVEETPALGGKNNTPQEGKENTPPGGKKNTPRGGKKITPEQEILLTTNSFNLQSIIPDGLNDPIFLEAFETLLTQKKWKKKPETAVKLALQKLGSYPVEFAVELVQNAIVGEYQGVVFPSTPEAFRKWQKENNCFTQNTSNNGNQQQNKSNSFDKRFAQSFRRTMGKIGSGYEEGNEDPGAGSPFFHGY